MDSIDAKILNNYFSLLERLHPAMKLSLIEKLSKSIRSESTKASDMLSSFGAWESKESAEDIIEFIRSNRSTDRDIEEF